MNGVPHQATFGRGPFARAFRALPTARPRASVGAPFAISPEEITFRGEGLDRGIQSLAQDAKRYLVYGDPATLRATAATIESLPGGSGTGPGSAADLRGQATLLDARIAARGAKKTAAEQNFSVAFNAFYQNWNAFFRDHVQKPNEVFNWDNWNKLDNFDAEYRTVWIPKYKTLGYPLTYLAPAPGAGKDKDESGIPWTSLLFIGGLVAAALFLREAKGLLPTPAPAPGRSPYRLPAKGGSTAALTRAPSVIHDAEFVEDPTDAPRTIPSYDRPGHSYEGPVSRPRTVHRLS